MLKDVTASDLRAMQELLEQHQVAVDIGSYKDAPPGLRIWCGATVDREDVEALMPWIEYAYEVVVKNKHDR